MPGQPLKCRRHILHKTDRLLLLWSGSVKSIDKVDNVRTRNRLLARCWLRWPSWPFARGQRLRRYVDPTRTGRRRQRRQADAGRLLHPGGGLQGADPGLQQDPGGRGRRLQPVLRLVGRAVARRRGRPAGRRRRVLARAGHHAARRRRPRRRGLEPERAQGHGHRLGRGVHGPQGQPGEHQDLGRPRDRRRRGARAEPVHLGRRQVEHHGRVRRPARAGQVARGGRAVPRGAVRERARARQERARVAPDLLERQGRRAARLRERGDPGPAEGRGARLHRSRPDDPDREPGRGRERVREPRARAVVRRLPLHARGPEDLRRARATARSSRALAGADEFPDAGRRCSTSRSSAAGTR